MKIAKVVGHVNGIPIWEYRRTEGSYLVREYGGSLAGKRSYIVKSPTEKLYCFSDYDGDVLGLLTCIQQGQAEKEQFACDLESIYDEF